VEDRLEPGLFERMRLELRGARVEKIASLIDDELMPRMSELESLLGAFLISADLLS
jgi:hypothetical protein